MIDEYRLRVFHKFGIHGFYVLKIRRVVGILNLLLFPFDEAVDEGSGSIHYLSKLNNFIIFINFNYKKTYWKSSFKRKRLIIEKRSLGLSSDWAFQTITWKKWLLFQRLRYICLLHKKVNCILFCVQYFWLCSINSLTFLELTHKFF